MKKVAASIGDAAGSWTSPQDRDNNSTTDNGSGNVRVTATWNANTPADPDADPPTAEVPMYASVTITGVQGGDIGSVIDKQQVDNSDPKDGDFDDDGDVKANAKMITGLPGFSHGFDITDGERTAIVFTDIEQQKGAVAAVTLKKAVNIVNGAVVVSRIGLPDDATTLENATYDHDGDSSTNALTGVTFTCTSSLAANCSYTIEDGKLKSMSGYVMSVSATTEFVLKAAQGAVADATYLAFGVWMDVDGDGDNTNALAPELGAFAGGGDAVGGNIEAVTGTATYSGKAAGVYTQGSSVDYFHADATLTADFGKKPTSGADTVNGTVKGTIDNIMAGGMATGDVITLGGAKTNGAIADAAGITDSATFAGVAHMGSGTTKNSITTYKYEGSWDGSFYNPVDIPAGEENAGQNDLTKAPGSAAGTFGVTGTEGEGDDAVTTSYVGAFGAHK